MILTTRTLEVQLEMSQHPIEDFISHQLKDLGANSYKRSTYFIRVIGIEKTQTDYLKMIQKIDSAFISSAHYLRLAHLDYQMSPKESETYIKIYENWLHSSQVPGEHKSNENNLRKEMDIRKLHEVVFPIHLDNEMLDLTQKCAFAKVMATYEACAAHVNASMVKNFGVKLLGWIAYYLPKLYPSGSMVLPKVVYVGEIKRQELLFLYFLSLMGCDVLYMNPKEDIVTAYPECHYFSKLYEYPYHQEVIVPKYEKAEPTRGVTDISSSTGQKGSIHLSRPSKEARTSSDTNNRKPMSATPIGEMRQAAGVSNIGNTRQPVGSSCVGGMRETQEAHMEGSGGLLGRSNGRDNSGRRELTYEELARLSTSIVMITVLDRRGEPYKSGSGVVIHQEGYILTNFHVIEGGARFAVRFENEEQCYETSRIIKYHSDYDLAIIKVEKQCRPLPVYGGNNLVRGQKVVAIGSPLGLFNSVSDGIISAFRKMKEQDMIQFTAPISHGSSGGALLDMYGRVIGIITAGIDEGQNLNLAVNHQMLQYFAGNYILSSSVIK